MMNDAVSQHEAQLQGLSRAATGYSLAADHISWRLKASTLKAQAPTALWQPIPYASALAVLLSVPVAIVHVFISAFAENCASTHISSIPSSLCCVVAEVATSPFAARVRRPPAFPRKCLDRYHYQDTVLGTAPPLLLLQFDAGA